MVNYKNMPNDRSVLQAGLYTTSNTETETFVNRVTSFNHRRNTNIILDIVPMENGDHLVKEPHYKLFIKFPSPEVQDAFWME